MVVAGVAVAAAWRLGQLPQHSARRLPSEWLTMHHSDQHRSGRIVRSRWSMPLVTFPLDTRSDRTGHLEPLRRLAESSERSQLQP